VNSWGLIRATEWDNSRGTIHVIYANSSPSKQMNVEQWVQIPFLSAKSSKSSLKDNFFALS
jgi:hypothetical protein